MATSLFFVFFPIGEMERINSSTSRIQDTPIRNKPSKLFFNGYKVLTGLCAVYRKKYLGLVWNEAFTRLLRLFLIPHV